MRTLFDPAELPPRRIYQVLTASVVPRPIAWVSTVSADGVANLAPYSFFSVSSTQPPVVQFTSVTRKDSLRNIEATGEFVINLATEPLVAAVNASSATYGSDVDEFAALGIETEPSERVRPVRVAGSPVAIECTLHGVTPVGDSFVVMGDVVTIAVRPEALADDGLPDFTELAPLSRLGRNEWGLPPRVVMLDRPHRPE
ncbi:flavin reductase family protein [Rhodococcus sp. ACS1]|uniref:NADH-FMN oxidoreductase RutF, flavin reductase (DIM6/NTAB) family n=1 Tax=Rhodococcus koreensis TaxID=99653 RepID=A0A1H4Z4Q1_9NOCA|nr:MULTISPECIES: flavin reductase family protein [Rhodococcus]PBC49010.1 flavin reductase family protein [Rhodococcus sp. ACS1]QSE79493.1 flavin reductase family protein [Rhodococcus koreensis]SED24865.1 NADH-FMN oxidoreductase RutF, flavin reductase (DIM6/NTAB) family [Rhodococcus koreensis]